MTTATLIMSQSAQADGVVRFTAPPVPNNLATSAAAVDGVRVDGWHA